MLTRDEMIEAVAQRLGRTRMELPVNDYSLDDARADNDGAWRVDDFPQPVRLDNSELVLAWKRAEELMRAWA